MKLNLKAAVSAFALTAILVLGTSASHATDTGQPTTNNKNAALPQVTDVQKIASALPEDLTVAPDPKLNASVSTLPGGATMVKTVFITTKKNTAPPLLSASLNVNAYPSVLSQTTEEALVVSNASSIKVGNSEAATLSIATTDNEFAMATLDHTKPAVINSARSVATHNSTESSTVSFNAATNTDAANTNAANTDAANTGIANAPRTALTGETSTATTLTAALTAPDRQSLLSAANNVNQKSTSTNS